ncbi:DUF4214 domain-containing protein [Massilia sp. HP4]|uniref:DUF4214 domain-containing protein n=1 Tax=Massilia sp. HP4 TaxID=2562316 RepID=UPI0010C07F0E|nr:DUF4214 domain-containing protein [Massilia sp. HP4]
MATQYDTQIQQLYVAYFNRPADAGGLAHWATVMANGGTTAQISAAFAQSLEYQVEYSQSTNAGIVNAVYQNLFGRDAETTGLEFWVKALNDKTMTVDNMVDLISKGAQGTDKIAFDSKVVVATAFTNALDTDAEKAGYSGADANKAAKELLAGIKTAAQATAAIVPATLDASIAKVVKAATPFTLEGGLEALGNAQKAIADFLDDAEVIDPVTSKPIKDVTSDDIAANVLNAEKAVAAEISASIGDYEVGVDLNNDGDYTDPLEVAPTLPSVKDALIKEQQAANTKALTAANTKLEAAQKTVNDVTGLAAAVATYTSAEEAGEAAQEAWQVAGIAEEAAGQTFATRNPLLDLDTEVDGDTTLLVATNSSTPLADPVTLAVFEGGAWSIATGLDVAKYPGLTALINAQNATIAAQEDLNIAEQAYLDAVVEVAFRDRTTNTETLLKAVPFDAADGPTVADGAVPTLAQLRAEWNALLEEESGVGPKTEAFRDALGDIRDDYTASLTTKGALLNIAEDEAEAAQTAIDDLAEAVEGLTAAKALAAELKGLNADLKVAQDDFVANKFVAPTMIDGNKFGTAGSDIFVFNDKTASISGFNRAGDDVLYVGAGFSLNDGETTDGDDAVLEVFFNQKGNNAEIIIETAAYGSDLAGGEGVKVITLVGVNIDDLTFENGIITL